MKRPLAFIAAVAALAFPAGLGMAAVPASAEPTDGPSSSAPAPSPTQTDDSPVRKVKGATFKWSVNDESTGGSYFGGCNFLVAGKAGDAGSSHVWNDADADKLISGGSTGALQDGNVSIHKSNGKATTFGNKCKDVNGKSVNGKPNTTAKPNHTGDYVQIDNGEGTINPETNSGRISWKGTWTFVYYGGMTYWSITDPTLVITNGKGKFTGTYSGVGADMDDPTVWIGDLTKDKHYGKQYVNGDIIDLQKTSVDLTKTGFSATPDYLGVKTKQHGRNEQAAKTKANASWWGAMPDTWVAFNTLTNQDSYWYTSEGGAKTIQPRKKANKLTVGYKDAGPGDPNDLPGGNDTKPADPITPPDTDSPKKPAPSNQNPPAATTSDSPSLYWGVNNESGSGAFYGGCNFLVAGASGDNGGARVWTNGTPLYKTKDGNVTIEKPDSSGTFHEANWDNKCLDRNGSTVSTTKKNAHTENRMVIRQGVRSDGSGGFTVKWKGSVTISFYGGMTYWSLNDPQLTVDAKGNGTLTATATGYGADMDKLDKWEKLTAQTVTMAEFSGVDVAKAKSDGGFTATPKFKGVRISDKGGRNPQDRSVKGWGSFPQSWIDFNIKTGQSSYWYTSGGVRDYAKPALPLTVALRAGYTPGESDYTGASDNGAAQNPNQGSNQNPNAAANPAGDNGAANKADSPQGADDDSAFAPTAAQARAESTSSPLTPAQWAGAGAIGTGALALTGGTGWFLRRRIGLDPTTWT